MTALFARSFAAAAALALARTGEALAQSCAMCGSSFGENDPVTLAFSWSILFMMAAPYTLAGLIGGYLFYAYWRGPRRDRAAIIRLAGERRPRPAPAGGSEGDIA